MTLCTIGISLPSIEKTIISPTLVFRSSSSISSSLIFFNERNKISPRLNAGSMLPLKTTTTGLSECVYKHKLFQIIKALVTMSVKDKSCRVNCRTFMDLIATKTSEIGRMMCRRRKDEDDDDSFFFFFLVVGVVGVVVVVVVFVCFFFVVIFLLLMRRSLFRCVLLVVFVILFLLYDKNFFFFSFFFFLLSRIFFILLLFRVWDHFG